MTLKTRVMMLKIQLCIMGINYILKNCAIENSIVFHNVDVFTVFFK